MYFFTFHWIVLQKEEATLVDEDFYSIESDGRQYYEQALIDNWVVVQHTYPSEDD